jgi:uncharacterized integral membrane protein
MVVFRWVIALVFLFVMVIFGVKNMQPVEVDYYFGSVRLPLFLLMAVLVMVGAVFAAVIGLAEQMRFQARIRRLNRRIDDLEKASAVGVPEPVPLNGRESGQVPPG